MKIKEFQGKTIQSIIYNYGIEILFTDGTTLEIDSRYEGGVEVTGRVQRVVTIEEYVYQDIERD